MIPVIEVKALKNYLLWVKFRNDEVKIFNCNSLIQDKLYRSLLDKEFFKTVHIDEMGVVSWNAALDIHPYYLYDESIDIDCFNKGNNNSIRLDKLQFGMLFYYDKEMTYDAVIVRNSADSDLVIVETQDRKVRAEKGDIEVYVDLSEEL